MEFGSGEELLTLFFFFCLFFLFFILLSDHSLLRPSLEMNKLRLQFRK